MSGSEYASETRHDHVSAQGAGADRAPGKSTVTSKMAGKATSIEDRLEALEGHLDQIEELGLKLMGHLSSGTAPTYAVAVRANLDAGAKLAEKLHGTKTTLKRKGLYDAAHEALTRLAAYETQYGVVADQMIGSAAAPKTRPSDAFGVPEDASEVDPALDQRTGFPAVDAGFVCMRGDAKGDKSKDCFLTDFDRGIIFTYLSNGVLSTMGNLHAAFSQARLEKLTATEHGWGPMEEFLYFAITGMVIGHALKGVGALKVIAAAKMDTATIHATSDHLMKVAIPGPAWGAIANVDEKGIQTVLTNGSRAGRGAAKAAVTGVSEANQRKAAFLAVLQEQVKPMADAILREAPATLDDGGLVSLAWSYQDMGEKKNHSIASYKEEINSIADRYVAQDIEEIGKPKYGGRRLRAARLVAYGFERMATLEEDMDQSDGPKPKRVDDSGRTFFHGWVDGRFEGIATDLNSEKVGEVETIDVTDGYLFSVHDTPKSTGDQRWIDESRYLGLIPDPDTLDGWIETCRRKTEGEGGPEDIDFAQQRRDDQVVGEPEDVDSEYREQQEESS